MIDATSSTDPLDDLAEEFTRRLRDGEEPSIEEYAARFPQWADDIRSVFPGILLMEQFKPRSTDQAAAPPHSADPMPERLGEYRLLREIGRGGMGVVYEAQQETLGRRVAIKVLPSRLFADDKMRTRFRRESQAAARLHHTNIVPVFAVGEQDGLHYYVMQLIVGRSLEVRHGDTATVRLSPAAKSQPIVTAVAQPLLHSAAAHLGVQVADALAYAHGQGVVHRDIKPSNLLMDERGTVWVTDFGVAKLLEESNLTGSGDLVGTLKYMPPERFHGQSDERGDVYSLGITLYEILAHRPAFPDTTPQHLIQLITHEEPPSLRKLDPSIPADLETIVLKAAARDPSQRYQKAADLADDLRRFLDDRPIFARRTTALELAWRWCRRNRVVATSVAAVFLLLIMTSAISIAAYLRTAAANRAATDANDKLTKALDAETTQRERAEDTSAAGLEALNRIFDHFAPNRIVAAPSLPAEGSAAEGVAIPPQPVLPPEAVPLLMELLKSYEKFAQEGGEQPRLQFQAAQANQRIGDIRRRFGQLEPAIAAYRKALELYARSSPAAQDDAAGIKVARTYNELGQALRTLQRTDEANTAHSQALEALEKSPTDFTKRPQYRYELARTYYFQAQREFTADPLPGPVSGPGGGGPEEFGRGPPSRGPGDSGRGPPGGPNGFGRGGPPDRGPSPMPGRGGPKPPETGDNPAFQKAVALLEDLAKEYNSVPEYRHLLACCYRDGAPRGPGGPGANSDRAEYLLRQLVKDYPNVPDYRYDLCETLARTNIPRQQLVGDKTIQAQRLLKEATLLANELAAQYPHVPQYAASRAEVHDRLGVLLHQMKKWDDAEEALRMGVKLQSDLANQHAEVVAYSFSLGLMEASLARLLTDRGQLAEARTLFETSVGRLELLRKQDERLRFVGMFLDHRYRELAQVLTKLGETKLAAEALRKAEAFGPGREQDGFGPRDRRGDK